MNSYETFNHILVKLFHDIMDIEQRAIITEEFKDITNNDMHVIEAIGIGEPKNMSTIAKALHVTTGTLTISMNSLVKKGYVKRERSETDRRVVYIMLTAKGKLAYRHHEAFHKKMTAALVRDMNPEDTKLLVQALTNLKNFFENYEKEEEE
ncbi:MULTISPECIES: MarR family winged helix-turn-helix transcriptional regulator [unclassified Candidatus Paralachnospira]|uniref:MarR family winged helix-turn-helix transcriptional regulator n=1 Tax=unclassified Candidatus Paralachnospira TaxID=3099471 RepID=UPI003F916833